SVVASTPTTVQDGVLNCQQPMWELQLAVFEDLAAYGRGRARATGALTEADIERLIHEARGV
ncbi:MAG: hypothetical protein CVT67_10080, partial [Actinobacteria bacterium HGW-Actinobacteria-7]